MSLSPASAAENVSCLSQRPRLPSHSKSMKWPDRYSAAQKNWTFLRQLQTFHFLAQLIQAALPDESDRTSSDTKALRDIPVRTRWLIEKEHFHKLPAAGGYAGQGFTEGLLFLRFGDQFQRFGRDLSCSHLQSLRLHRHESAISPLPVEALVRRH